LILLGGFGVAAAVLVYPGRDAFIDDALAERPDDVALAYLRLAREHRPEDDAARVIHARALHKLGRVDEALEVLEPALERGGGPPLDARLLALELRWVIHHRRIAEGDAVPSEPAEVPAHVSAEIRALAGAELGDLALERLFRLSLEIGEPALAARLAERLARAIPAAAEPWLAAAGRWHLAAGDPRAAAERLLDAARAAADPETSRRRGLEALDALAAADDALRAAEAAEDLMRRYPDDVEVLERGLHFARARGDASRAAAIGRRVVGGRPRDGALIARQIALDLEAGEVGAALELCLRRVALEPEDRGARVELARVAEWAGEPRLALEAWAWLARRHPRDAFVGRARELAIGLFEHRLALEMAEIGAAHRHLDRDAIIELVDVYLRVGEEGRAVEFLEACIARWPDARHAYELLADIEDGRSNPARALEVLEELSCRFAPLPEEMIRRAELLWSVDRPRQALELLRSHARRADADDARFWSLLAQLAWTLESDDDALAACERLWPNAADAGIADLYFGLLRQRGRGGEAVDLAEEAWRRFAKPRQLLDGVELALDLEQPERARGLLERAGGGLQDSERSLVLRARLAAAESSFAEAIARYEAVLDRHPENRRARGAYLWLLIDQRALAKLDAALARWRAAAPADPLLWPACAAGFHLLGRPQEALPWYARRAPQEVANPLWLLAYASALDETGRANSAERLRRYSLAELRRQTPELLARAAPLPEAAGAGARTSAGRDIAALRALVLLEREFRGTDAAEEEIASMAAAVPAAAALRELAIDWSIEERRLDPHAGLAAERGVRGLDLEAWQRLDLAMQSGDIEAAAAILAAPGTEPAAVDRVRALRFLGRDEEAYGVALDALRVPGESEAEAGLLREAVELRGELYTGSRLLAAYEDFNKLGIASARAASAVARAGWSLELEPAHRDFDGGSRLDLDGRESEEDIALEASWRRRRGASRLRAGVREQEEDAMAYLRVEERYVLPGRGDLSLVLGLNEPSEDSPALLVAGARHRAGGSASAALGARERVRAAGFWRRVHSRSGAGIGDGYQLEAEAEHRVILEEPSLGIRAGVAWSEHRLSSRLPGDIEDVLDEDAEVEDLVAPRAGVAGVGARIESGEPGEIEGWSGRCRLLLDAWVGWLWTSDALAWRVEGGLGHPIFGGDELSLRAFFADGQGGLDGQERMGVSVSYLWRF
jgi:predicted Zn-dependent protease